MVAALRSVARSEGAALVHCAAGKDRTGVVVAVALRAVGVRPEAVIADYAATGERIGPLLARLRRSPAYAADMGSEPDESHRPRRTDDGGVPGAGGLPLRRGRRLAGRARLRPR